MLFRKGLLAVVCLAGVLSLVRADVKVSEASPQKKVWRKLYAKLPEKWQTHREIVVEEVSGAELKKIAAEDETDGNRDDADNDTDIDGCYQNAGAREPIRIFIRETLRGEEAELVFLHEYGHFVWDEFLTEDQQAAYTKIWDAQKRAHHLVSDYAETDVEEGFAESISYALRKPQYLSKRDPRSARYCERLISE